ncbi:hypothetical protein EYF80_047006 [Liparis tanakae]|uniref:Uncharacterized protein n=1 Tax=Liparis tanakae TaxID=230148 RepID=A0A4Z2FNI9_9TELE|nr:hypothetical protein EYF80_047006 [Liparis tanakae]
MSKRHGVRKGRRVGSSGRLLSPEAKRRRGYRGDERWRGGGRGVEVKVCHRSDRSPNSGGLCCPGGSLLATWSQVASDLTSSPGRTGGQRGWSGEKKEK